MDRFIEWLKQQSTWKGLAGLGAMFGIAITPEFKEQIIAIAVMVYTAVALFKDKN